MKKFLLIIILGFFMAISANAQIQRKFFDFQLGTTPKDVVANYFKTKGNKVAKNEDDFICVESVKFGGHTWPLAFFKFYKGKLQVVYFSEHEDNLSIEYLNNLWDNLRYSLSNKYMNFIDEDITKDNEIVYSDFATKLILKYEYHKGKKVVSIFYNDLYLINKERDSYNDEF